MPRRNCSAPDRHRQYLDWDSCSRRSSRSGRALRRAPSVPLDPGTVLQKFHRALYRTKIRGTTGNPGVADVERGPCHEPQPLCRCMESDLARPIHSRARYFDPMRSSCTTQSDRNQGRYFRLPALSGEQRLAICRMSWLERLSPRLLVQSL